MTSGFEFEKASERLNNLLGSDLLKQLRGANEAETRLLLIDEVLILLGWAKQDFHPEQHATSGYTDYRLTFDGQPRLIVEAKRIGLVAPIPDLLHRKDYSNDYLHKSCGL